MSICHWIYLHHDTEDIRRPQSQPITWLQYFLQIVSCEGLHLGWLAISYKFMCGLITKYQELDMEGKSTADNKAHNFYYNMAMIFFVKLS